MNWDKFEFLKDQAWLNYGGFWGEDTKDLRGWDGPEGPTRREKWKIDSDTIYEKINKGILSGYKGGHILKNRHEIG